MSLQVNRLLFVALCMCLLLPDSVGAQQTAYDVFFDPTGNGLYFVDARTGLSSVATVEGSQHTLLDTGVLFQDAFTGQPRLAAPDGQITTLAWIAPATQGVVVRWVVSTDRNHIAWSEVQSDGTNVISLVYAARSDGGDRKQVLRFSSTRRLAALPVHLATDGRTLYYTRQLLPEPGAYDLFERAADLYALDVRTGESTHLPDEPLCECAVGFTADGRQYARLQTEDDGNGFLVRLRDQAVGKLTILNAVDDLLHTQAGYVVVSPNGNIVLYASARGTGSLRSERWTLTLADRDAGTQTLLTGALTDGIRPLTFALDGKSVILIGITKPGTWKMALADRRLRPISAYNYLGSLRSDAQD